MEGGCEPGFGVKAEQQPWPLCPWAAIGACSWTVFQQPSIEQCSEREIYEAWQQGWHTERAGEDEVGGELIVPFVIPERFWL